LGLVIPIENIRHSFLSYFFAISIAEKQPDYQEREELNSLKTEKKPPRQPGSAEGKVWIADDFDAPLTTY
jgi:hypothetical protein